MTTDTPIPTRRILHRWTQAVLWAGPAETVKDAIHAAIAADSDLRDSDLSGSNLSGSDLSGSDLSGSNLSGSNLSYSNLRGSNLRGSDLRGSDLRGSNLRGANLTGAYLTYAYLTDANLTDANLTGANLTGANLTGANLTGAYLTDAYLTDANLTGADLTDANLTDANLRDAYLTPIRDDFWAVLSGAPQEVPALIAALTDGRVDGSTYQGACACLVGTLANARGCAYTDLAPLVPNSSRPAEIWFMGIATGDTPATNERSRLAVEWATEWLDRVRAAFAPTEVSS